MTAVRVINEAIERIETLEQENLLLRQLLWAWHRCSGTVFGQDGALQCVGGPGEHCAIDFKRDSAQSIQEMLQAPSIRFIHEHQDDRCRHCGVTRWTWEANALCTGVAHDWQSHGG